MRMAEVRKQYQGEWVLIKFESMADLTDDLSVIDGTLGHTLALGKKSILVENGWAGELYCAMLGRNPQV
jgi:hypothetical protein